MLSWNQPGWGLSRRGDSGGVGGECGGGVGEGGDGVGGAGDGDDEGGEGRVGGGEECDGWNGVARWLSGRWKPGGAGMVARRRRH